ncbi:hypothetical protein EYF80_028226 [Liparis tanakae]|uniref:Uncharacterized protein n=1 Tax=Liparis tanakae TaxID=230148 RepID=A0A4Z2H9R6_9TELE|nr:hypothetical protein EYF80_028226 [Liparis tanakae]
MNVTISSQKRSNSTAKYSIVQRNNETTKQRNNETTKQRNNETMKQRNNETTKPAE